MPGFGAFAYLLAKPFREQRALGAILADQSLRKLPARTYSRLHLGALTTFWARPQPVAAAGGATASRLLPATRARLALLRGHAGLIALLALANAALLSFAATLYLGFDQRWALGEPGLVNATDALQLLAAGVLGVLVFRRFWSPRRDAARSVEESAGVFLWGAVGLGLIVFAVDDFFGVHEAVGAFGAETLRIPIMTNNVDDFVTLGYGLGGLVLLYLFRHEVFAPRASSALFIAEHRRLRGDARHGRVRRRSTRLVRVPLAGRGRRAVPRHHAGAPPRARRAGRGAGAGAVRRGRRGRRLRRGALPRAGRLDRGAQACAATGRVAGPRPLPSPSGRRTPFSSGSACAAYDPATLHYEHHPARLCSRSRGRSAARGACCPHRDRTGP